MATVSKWTPFGVALDITATGGAVTRVSATQFTVSINVSWETYYSGAQTNYGMTAASGGVTKTISAFNGTKRSSGSGSFVGTYSISGNGSATKTITVTFRNFNTDNGDAATKNVTFNVTVPAWTSYTVKYNANGGSGAPGNQTKWKDQALTLSSTKPTRTGYSFQGWSTSTDTSVEYKAGAEYKDNSAVTLYAVWKANIYTVKYNANGGSGEPSNQTKTYGKTLTLSSTKPTRKNYNFLGWATSSTATTAKYAAGASYTANSAVTLYAVWELAYVKPRITNTAITRCDSTSVASDNGTYALVAFDWACDQALTSIVIEWESISSGSGTKTVTATGTSGRASELIGDGALNTEATYTVRIIVTDANGYTYAFRTLNGIKLPIDFLPGAKGAACGKPAELENVLDVAYQAYFRGGILPPVLEPETNLDDIRTPNTYIGEDISDYNYVNCPVTNGTFTLIVESCGEDGQVRQTYISCSKYAPKRYVRFFYQGTWGDWFWAGTEEYVLYENSEGSAEAITLASTAGNYRYIEIYFTDNNGKTGGYTKVWNPNGKAVSLHMQEAGTSVWSRQTTYTISGTTMTPSIDTACYVKYSGSSLSIVSGTNYIRIVRVIGRA